METIKWTVAEWKEYLKELTPQQISQAIAEIPNGEEASLWKEQIFAAINGLTDTKQLEAVGKSLNLSQIIAVLNTSEKQIPNRLVKLTPLFVGITPSNFRALLLIASPKQMSLLKLEALTEAIQHHISLLNHELKSEMTKFEDNIARKEKETETLSLDDIGSNEINALFQGIYSISKEGREIIKEASSALSVAWNTNRSDLIEQLSKTKAMCQKILIQVVGCPIGENQATGLWGLLEKKLNSVFENSNAFQSETVVDDDEPAIESLIKFSIWYIHDYWEIGLLPKISKEDLELSSKISTEQELLKNRENLFIEAEKNLEKIGLKTLKDLKKAHIYSKKILKEYIKTHLNNF